jgi:hypothetical protein
LDLKIKRNGAYINPLTYLQGIAGGGGGTGGNYAGKYASIIRSAAARFGVSPALVAGIIKQESKFNPNARSPVGATGLMQLMPATARAMGVRNPRDPQQNIMGGTKYISQMLRMFGGNTKLGLAAYNAGPGNVKKYGGVPPFKETQNYVRIVMANARAFGAQFGGARKYKNGTGIGGHPQDGPAVLGDGGKNEPFMLPNGQLGLSPNVSTLFPDLPKGTMVWSSLKEFFKQYNPFPKKENKGDGDTNNGPSGDNSPSINEFNDTPSISSSQKSLVYSPTITIQVTGKDDAQDIESRVKQILEEHYKKVNELMFDND